MSARPASELGMTLVEMLAVLAIIGIAAGAIVMGFGPAARRAGGDAEAHRLAGQIQMAADDAMIDDSPAIMRWNAQGYRIREQEEHRLPAGMRLDIPGMDGSYAIGGTPFVARLYGGDREWQVRFDGVIARAQVIQP